MKLHGIGIGRGIAVGPVVRMPEALPDPVDSPFRGDVEAEVARVSAAAKAVSAELVARGKAAGGPTRQVLEAEAQMALDPTAADSIEYLIRSGRTGERAVFEAFGSFRDLLINAGGLTAERAIDVDDVSRRIVAHLQGVEVPEVPASAEPFILVATDLAPAATATLDLELVLAFVTREGGSTSHTAILAREKGIPAVLAVAEADDLVSGTVVMTDAATGTVTVGPTAKEVAAVTARRQEARESTGPGKLKDGTPIPLLANLGYPDDAADAREKGAEGVGLFRTEFLFLNKRTAPTAAEQQAEYTRLFDAFPGEKVVIRVLDAGADKPLAFLAAGKEPNPALGVRGLRALRAHPEILHDQLSALAAAAKASTADVHVMAPMVADAAEAAWFVDAARAAGLANVGVMAEVPSIAFVADQVVAASDFVSIGTNDLTQYILASDRMLGALAGYQDAWHPAVLSAIKLIAEAGQRAGKAVGVCGEAAADPKLAVVFVGLGVTSLSMAPAAIADVRSELATVTLETAQRIATAALAAGSAADARVAASEI